MAEKPSPPIILASASPRRRALLEARGLNLVIARPEIEETPRAGEAPDALVERLAIEKNEAIAAGAVSFVISGDTVVALDEQGTDVVLGKPRDAEDARAMLGRLSGTTHRVLSGWCVRRDRVIRSGVISTEIDFRDLSSKEIEDYVATGEPLDKAGAYAIQERGSTLVAAVRGSIDNVVGLPVEEVITALRELGASLPG